MTELETQSIDQTQIPPRFRQAAFDRYESLIAACISEFPKPYKIRCALYDLSSVTMSCRMRDAIKSWVKYRWPTTMTENQQKRLLDFHDEIIISESANEGFITVGSKSTIKSVLPALLDHHRSAKPSIDIVYTLSPEDAHLICNLAAHRVLAVPIRANGLSDELITKLELEYDVAIDKNSDGTVTII